MDALESMRVGPVIPVIVSDDVAHAVPLARALVAGRVRALEVTWRTRVARDVSRCNVLSDRGRDGGKRAWLSGASECRVRRRIVVDPARRGQGRCMGKDHSTRARGFEIALERRLTKLPTAGSLTAPLEA